MWCVELEYTFSSSSSIGLNLRDRCATLKVWIPKKQFSHSQYSIHDTCQKRATLGNNIVRHYLQFRIQTKIQISRKYTLAHHCRHNYVQLWISLMWLLLNLLLDASSSTPDQGGRGRGMTFSCLTWGGNTAELVRRAISGFNKNWPLCYSQLNLSPSSSSCCKYWVQSCHS